MVNSDGIFTSCTSISLCLLLAVGYVASLYVWRSQYDRNHPNTIKKRCISVLAMTFISPCICYIGIQESVLHKVKFLELLGIRTEEIVSATLLPFILTLILFVGPIAMQIDDIVSRNSVELNLQYLVWFRNYFVAPLSEEFTFRCCMMPLLLQAFRPLIAVFICPLFFGITHFHHMQDRIKFQGVDFNTAMQIACFQFLYTTLFGLYSAYVFLQTQHLISIFVIHSFCNFMGFPDISTLLSYKKSKKILITVIFLCGFLMWCFLLPRFTQSKLYHSKEWYIRETNSMEQLS